MAKNMFISTHNQWFSRLALLASLMVLVKMSLSAYHQQLPTDNTLKISILSIQFYLSHSILVVILFSTIAAWYLPRELSFKPFFISLALLLLIAIQYLIPLWAKSLLSTNYAILIQNVINLCVLSLFWWIKSVTGSPDNIFISETDKKYRLWACLGLLLLFLQIAFAFLVNQEPFVKLYLMANTVMVITTSYLLILSILVIFSRTLGETGILLFFLIMAAMATSITEFIWHKSFWLTFSRDILFLFTVLAMTSLLIDLFRKPAGSYH